MGGVGELRGQVAGETLALHFVLDVSERVANQDGPV